MARRHLGPERDLIQHLVVGGALTVNGLATVNSLVVTAGLNTSQLTAGTLGVARGGTGLATVTSGNFLTGNGTGAFNSRTPAEARSDIGADNATNLTTGTLASARLPPAMRIVGSEEAGPDETEPTGTTYVALTYANGLTFVAPPSGIVVVDCEGDLRLALTSASARILYIGFEVRTGSTIGSGTVFLAANDQWAAHVGIGPTSGLVIRCRVSTRKLVSGLTAGNSYNVRHMKRISTASDFTSEIRYTRLVVTPSS
jgi:hypothetical protein